MKLTNLFRKLATAALALAVVGMLAACSNGSSSSDSANYKIMYDDILIADGGTAEDMEETKQLISASYYTMNGNTMILNDDGFDFALKMWTKNESDPCIAIVVYQKKMIMPVTESQMTAAANVLKTPADYTVTHNGKVIELTDAGYTNGAALFGEHHGSGNDDDDDDGEQVMGGFNLMYDDILLLEKGTQSNFDELKAEFPSNSYTVKDKTVTLNDTGLSKFLEYYAKKAKSPKPYVAIVVYNKKMLMPVTQAEYDMAASKLTEGTDYTVTHNDKVIELTDSGHVNGASLFRN